MNEREYTIISNRIRINLAIHQIRELGGGDEWGVTEKEVKDLSTKLYEIEDRLFKLIESLETQFTTGA
jgi:hypothetical protein